MALVTGPAMSLDASGALAGAVVFAKWKGRNYVRQLVRPANPQSAMQVAMRAMMRALSQAWAALSDVEKGGWDELASQSSISAFNAYVRTNQSRWRNFMGPYKTPADATGSGTQPALNSALAEGAPSAITVQVNVATLNQGWGIVIHRSLGATAAPTISNAVRVITFETGGVKTFVDSPLAAGHYYYSFSTFTQDGSEIETGAATADASAT